MEAKLTEIDVLLVQLMEECAEMQQILSKIFRFGIENEYTMENKTNLNIEFCDMIAIARILEEKGFIDTTFLEENIQKKKEKIEKYMKITFDLRNKKEDVSNAV